MGHLSAPRPFGEWNDLFAAGLERWTMAGPGGFVAADGAHETRGGMGLLWYAPRRFRDFELEVQWRARSRSDNSGVFVRFPDPNGDPWDAVHRGYEVQILDDAEDPERRTGAIYTFAGPDRVLSKEPGEWNDLRVLAVGQRYDVWVNTEHSVTFDGDRGLEGYVGLQNHDDRSRVQFRALRVREVIAG